MHELILSTGLSFLFLCRYMYIDDEVSFSDFKPFGGWTKPAMKTYKCTIAESCSMAENMICLTYAE